MQLFETTADEYTNAIPTPLHVFNSAAFNHLNADKVDRVRFLLFRDPKVRLGLVAGERDGVLSSPFSAPFGGFSYVRADIGVDQLDACVEALVDWARAERARALRMTLPPLMYEQTFLSKTTNALLRAGFEPEACDLNYSFDLRRMAGDYLGLIWRNARKNLKRAQNHGLVLEPCSSIEECWGAYEIIRKNREAKGYPLRMTWKQVERTIEILKADFFVVRHEDRGIAAAQVFHVARDIVQVIYWGELVESNHLRPMNFLPYELFRHYDGRGGSIVDLGPSTEDSIPNYGLCDFKESIGCDTHLKLRLIKNLA